MAAPTRPTSSQILKAGAAGVLAAGAYAAEMWLDLRLLRYRFNDFTLLGRPFTSSRKHWMLLGALIHACNGFLFGAAYAFVHPRLRGPGWARGALAAQVENLVLWPFMLLVDRYHPGRRDGELAPAWSSPSFLVAVLRHLAFGLALGLLYRPKS